MNELTRIYKDHNVRIIEKDGQPWFAAKDVAEILGYSETAAMTRRLDKDEKTTLRLPQIGLNNYTTNITVLNEYGLFAAILKSNKKEAIDFQRWVTHEVLPSIRRTGSYSMTNNQPWYRLKPRFSWNDLPALTEEKRKLDRIADERDYVQEAINRVRYEEATKRLSPHDVERELFRMEQEHPYAIRKEEQHEQLPELPGGE